MLTTLIYILIVFLVLWVIYFLVGKFVSGTVHQVIGIILVLIFLLYVLKAFNVALPGL